MTPFFWKAESRKHKNAKRDPMRYMRFCIFLLLCEDFGRVFFQQAGCLFPIDLQNPGDQWFNPESATNINEGVGRYGSENRRPFNLMQYSIQIGKDMSENESDSMVFQSDSSQGIPVRFIIFVHVFLHI